MGISTDFWFALLVVIMIILGLWGVKIFIMELAADFWHALTGISELEDPDNGE